MSSLILLAALVALPTALIAQATDKTSINALPSSDSEFRYSVPAIVLAHMDHINAILTQSMQKDHGTPFISAKAYQVVSLPKCWWDDIVPKIEETGRTDLAIFINEPFAESGFPNDNDVIRFTSGETSAARFDLSNLQPVLADATTAVLALDAWRLKIEKGETMDSENIYNSLRLLDINAARAALYAYHASVADTLWNEITPENKERLINLSVYLVRYGALLHFAAENSDTTSNPVAFINHLFPLAREENTESEITIGDNTPINEELSTTDSLTEQEEAIA